MCAPSVTRTSAEAATDVLEKGQQMTIRTDRDELAELSRDLDSLNERVRQVASVDIAANGDEEDGEEDYEDEDDEEEDEEEDEKEKEPEEEEDEEDATRGSSTAGGAPGAV